MHSNKRVQFRKTALAVLLGACLSQGVALAQSTSGDIVGTTTASDATIQIKSVSSGVTREVTVSGGRFRIPSLPTGDYEVTLSENGTSVATRTVTVIAGQSASVSFADATALDTVIVRASGPNSIDTTSVESRTTFTAKQLNELPVPRDITSVSLLTPGTVSSSGYFNNASFGGASAAENSYYVNGFNVTNLYDSLSFTEVPFQAIDQLDIQTGGYGAKYGFSTGGVTSVNVKHGTNEWKGGFSWTAAPDSLRESVGKVYRNDGEIFRNYDNNYNASNVYTAWVGGPLIKDKLFVYALGQLTDSHTTSYGARSSTSDTSTSATAYDYNNKVPYELVKLDWYPNDWNHVEYTGFRNRGRYTYDYYTAAYDTDTGDVSKTKYKGQLVGKTGGQTNIFKWTSYLTDNLTASLQYGQMHNRSSQFTVSPDGVMSYYDGNITGDSGACPYVYSYVVGSQIGCAVTSSVDMYGGSNKRDGGKLDFEWQLGNHKIGFGYSDEDWKSVQGSSYSAGAYWVIRSSYAYLINYRTGGSVSIDQKSWYLEDNWQITDNFMLYYGIRNDGFENKNTAGETFVKQDNIWQPRVGFSWDIAGDGTSKLFASLGRYSLPISANVALRAASASYYTVNYYTYSGVDATNGVPNVTGSYADGAYDTVYNGENGSVPDAKAVASKGLKPYTQDEAILGYQYQLSTDNAFLDAWTLGIKGTYRRINNVIDDTCDARSVYNAATAAGYDLSNWEDEWTVPGNLPGCWLYNPGEDLTITMDVDGDGSTETITVPGSELGPKAKRYYKAVTLSADKQTDKWYASVNYTWAKLSGNYEGLVKSTNGQDDTGTTSDFDFAEIMYGSDGYLFNDHRHTLKAYGAYNFTPEWQAGIDLQVQSGSPISCYGGGSGTFGTEYGYGGSFHYCNGEISKLGTVGRTPWTYSVGVNAVYRPAWAEGLSMQLSVLNLFNNVKPLQVYEQTENTTYGYVYNNYLVGKYYTTPRYARLQLQYDW